MVTLVKLENGNLKIVLSDKDELIDLRAKPLFDNGLLGEILETSRYIGNDWHVPKCIGLTEAPAIGYGQIQDENDENEFSDDYEKVWFYPDYMISDFSEVLLNENEVIFLLT